MCSVLLFTNFTGGNGGFLVALLQSDLIVRGIGGARRTEARVSEATRGSGGGFDEGATVAVFLRGLCKLNDVNPLFVVAVDGATGFFRISGILLTDFDRLNLLNNGFEHDEVEFEVVSSLTILSGLLLR